MSNLRPCAIEDCDRMAGVPGSARGWCGIHYQRWQRHGDPHFVKERKPNTDPCKVEDCDKPRKGRGLCAMHYSRLMRHGSLVDPRNPWPKGTYCCAQCREVKPLSEFGVRNREARGHSVTCKPCVNAASRVSKAKNPERVRRNNAAAVADGRAAAKARKYRERHPERAQAAWERAHAKRRARLARVEYEEFPKREIFKRDGWVCQLCEEPMDRTYRWPHTLSPSIDHIVPIAKGGAHTRENVQSAHLICNQRKGARRAA